MIPATPLAEAYHWFRTRPQLHQAANQGDPAELRKGLNAVLGIVKYQGIGVRDITTPARCLAVRLVLHNDVSREDLDSVMSASTACHQRS